MNAVSKFLLILLLSGLWSSVASAQQPSAVTDGSPKASGPQKPANSVVWKPSASWLAAKRDGTKAVGLRLVILVSGDDVQNHAAIGLQGLLESEAFRGWHGELLERAQLEAVLREQRLGAALGEANAIRLGQVAQADFLLLVSVESNRVRCRVNQFPSTVVVAEFELPSASEDRLAKQIALRAFRAMAERSRDASRITIAIGSFLVDDPFSKYTDLDHTLHGLLLERLAKVERIDIVERFHPTQLLREFELGRAGLVPSAMAQLTAPASDVLIVGDIQPTAKQNLNSKDIELNFRVRVISPTGLFEAFDVTFALLGADAKKAAEQIAKAVQQKITSLPAALSRRTASDGLNSEYATLKQRAFRLLPQPPLENGDFYKNGSRGSSQTGKPAQIERAMRAVENTLLLNGDDTQLLVCVIPLLFAMAQQETPNRRIEKPSPRQKALLEMSCDYVETVLALDFNENTRGITVGTLSHDDYWFSTPDRVRPIIERMVREGTVGGWYRHQVDFARVTLVEHAPDLKAKIAMFREARHDGHLSARTLFGILERVVVHYLVQRNAKADGDHLRALAVQLRELAEELMKDQSAFQRGMGAYTRVFVSYYAEPRDPHWEGELCEAIDLLPAVSKELGEEFDASSLSLRIYDFVRWSNEKNPTETSRALMQRYVTIQVEMKNFGDYNLVASCFQLLPSLDRKERRAEGVSLLENILEHYTTSADLDRMRLARWRNHFRQSLSHEKFLSSNDLIEIKLDGGKSHTRVKKVVLAFDRVWALRCDYDLRDFVGEVFVLAPAETKAVPLRGLSNRITDLTAAADQMAVASIDNGLYLVNPTGKVSRQLRPGDSPLPELMVRTVATDGSRFFLGLPGREEESTRNSVYFFYDLDLRANTLIKTDTALDYRADNQFRFDKNTSKVVAQTWDNRFYEADGERWTFRRQPLRNAINDVTVTDSSNKVVFKHTGFDLNYVYDFVHWQDRLLFATGNGLYVARPNTDRLTCVLNELDLEFFSLCPVGDKLFVGTNRGLHRLDAKVLSQLDEAKGERTSQASPSGSPSNPPNP